MKSKTSKADQFSEFFDNNWKKNKSSIRTRHDNARQYDVSYSWDAKSDNPKSFSRLQATYLPYQPVNPLTLSGSAVVLLEETTGFSAINVKQPNKVQSTIPLTSDQRDLGMKTDLTAEIPFVNDAKGKGKVVLVDVNQSFKNHSVVPPVLVQGELPAYMTAAGPQCDQILLNPQQRREIISIEKKKKEADDLVRAAQSNRIKTRQQMMGLQFHRGALMIDSSDNMDSEIYGQRATKLFAEQDYKRQIHLERSSRLAAMQSSMHINGNILLPDSLGPRVKTDKFYQSKGGDFHALSFDETHNRLFCRLQGASKSERTQFLRDVETSGKPYDIVHLKTVEHWPPKVFDREVKSDLTHPSQATLEGQRSLQGSLRNY